MAGKGEEASTVAGEGVKKGKSAPTRDIRRYYCEHCGICRSKKALITAHVLSHHKDKIQDGRKTVHGPKQYTCSDCDAVFKKPAHLKQHMQGHSFERPFTCPLDDCHSSYRRQDHLTRHLLTHQGKLFTCSIEGCGRQFTLQANMKRHINKFHDEDKPCPKSKEKLYTCSDISCGKTFKYPSRLRKHERSHVKLDGVEVICGEPGCMKYFSSKECLKAHVQSCHRYIKCPVCGTQQLKMNIKRHMRTHEQGRSNEIFSCSFNGCLHKFSSKASLDQHVKAVHLQRRPFACRISGCGKKFAFKHVRDNHEKSGVHVHVHGDFLEADERFRARSVGGRKRKCFDTESLVRKRVAAPAESSILDNGSDYLRWLLDDESSP